MCDTASRKPEARSQSQQRLLPRQGRENFVLAKTKLFLTESSIAQIYFSTVSKYNLSTFFLAQGVRRKNVRLDLIDGSTTKQLIRILSPSSGNPYVSTKNTRIASSVFPCNGLFDFSSIMMGIPRAYLLLHEYIHR